MTIRSPKLGNIYTFDTGVVDIRTMDGTLLQSETGLETNKFHVTFEALDSDTREYFESFLENSIGELITITDHEGYDWEGFIIDDNPEIISEGRGCFYSVSFAFEGRKL